MLRSGEGRQPLQGWGRDLPFEADHIGDLFLRGWKTREEAEAAGALPIRWSAMDWSPRGGMCRITAEIDGYFANEAGRSCWVLPAPEIVDWIQRECIPGAGPFSFGLTRRADGNFLVTVLPALSGLSHWLAGLPADAVTDVAIDP